MSAMNAMGMNVLHIVAGLNTKSGGPSRAVTQLTDALVQYTGTGVTLLSQSLPDQLIVESRCGGVHRKILLSRSNFMLKAGWPIRQELDRITRNNCYHLVHSHGLWLPVNYWASRAVRKMRVPLVIQPRGMLEPWAVNHKAYKKKIAMFMYQRRDLNEASALIATSRFEYQNLRSLGVKQPIAIIPNGVMLDNVESDSRSFLKNQAERTVLFLSRIHPVKGLINLIETWANVVSDGWHLQIVGPDEGGHLKELLVKAKQLKVNFDYVGEVDGKDKAAIFQGADIFVLPTFSENFGIVIAEALAYGLPVITTKGAPWADIESYRCGWWIDIGVEPLTLALREAMALTDEERREIGARGKKYVRRFAWTKISEQTADLYRWLLDQGPLPDFVQLK